MTAAIDRYNALIGQIKRAFEQACPDIPLCRDRIQKVFSDISMISDTGDELDIHKIIMLAEDLGLEPTIHLRKKSDAP